MYVLKILVSNGKKWNYELFQITIKMMEDQLCKLYCGMEEFRKKFMNQFIRFEAQTTENYTNYVRERLVTFNSELQEGLNSAVQ